MSKTVNKRELSKQKTSRAILDASMHVFGKLGFYATTYTDISKIAKVTNGLIVQRFISKENLFSIIFDEVLIDNFPALNTFETIDDGLIVLIKFVKDVAAKSNDASAFACTALSSLETVPEKCSSDLKNIFIGTKLETLLEQKLQFEDITKRKPFDVFVSFLRNCFEFTLNSKKNGAPLASDDLYLQLFAEWNTSSPTKVMETDLSPFAKISKDLYGEVGLSSWYADFTMNDEPSLYLQPRILKQLGLSELTKPEDVYRYMYENVVLEDKIIVQNAISRLMNGESVEFTFAWSTSIIPEMHIRCFANRKYSGKVTRFEGFFQNTDNFSTIKNRKHVRELLISSISKDYEFLSYIHMGPNAEDDQAEDYKNSEFINKITNKWEGKTSVRERLRLLAEKIVSNEERDNFILKTRRPKILENLKTNTSYKVKFKVQYYGIIHEYEIIFIADRDSIGFLHGMIYGLRLVQDNQNKLDAINKLVDMEKKDDRIKAFNSLFVDNYEATYLVNLTNHSFETFSRSDTVKERNLISPDFELYFHSYVKRDVYFEDKEMMLRETSIETIRERLKTTDIYAFNFRDIAKGKPLYYKMRIIKAGVDTAAIGFLYINEEHTREVEEKERLEVELREKEFELKDKDLVIKNMNGGIIDLIVDVVEARRENTSQHSRKIKEITYILANQLCNDCPDLKLTKEDISVIAEASVLHDIGKISIPDDILYKPGILTPDELEIMKQHSEAGVKIIEKLRKFWTESYYQTVLDIAKYHHERWNGEGYPEGLKGNDIPLSAQIVSLTDVFDALLSKRVYKGPYEPDVALKMILNNECGTFNPRIIESFLKCFDELVACVKGGEEVSFEKVDVTTKENDPYKYVAVINDETLPIITRMSEQMPGGFFIYKNDSQGTMLFYNDCMLKYFKCNSREEFINYINNSFRGLVHPDDYERVHNMLNSQASNTVDHFNNVKYRIICSDGEVRYLNDFSHLVHSDTYGDIFYVFVLDITASEKAIMRAEEKNATKGKNVVVSNPNKVKMLDGVRILLVDDNDLSRFTTKDVLEAEGAYVSDFGSGEDALDLLRKVRPFDIILVDLVLPGMSGPEFTQKVRNWEEDKDIRVPIVGIFGSGADELMQECIDAGANGCMRKPLVINELSRLLILSMKEHYAKMERKLEETIHMATTDALTHVKSVTAYAEALVRINAKIEKNPNFEFGVLIADINRLKEENDTFGHDVGDIYIKNCCKLLCDAFAHSPVYRIGGDEFAVILTDTDLANYEENFEILVNKNNAAQNIEDSKHGKACISAGIAIYKPGVDFTIQDVVKRADDIMYENKRQYKANRKKHDGSLN